MPQRATLDLAYVIHQALEKTRDRVPLDEALTEIFREFGIDEQFIELFVPLAKKDIEHLSLFVECVFGFEVSFRGKWWTFRCDGRESNYTCGDNRIFDRIHEYVEERYSVLTAEQATA